MEVIDSLLGRKKEENTFYADRIVIDTTKNNSWFGSKGITEQTYLHFVNQYERFVDCEILNVQITTNGGDLMYALMIADILSKHKGRTIARIPKYAMSGGTLIALACDEIAMSPYAFLSPFDPVVNYWAPLSISNLLPVVDTMNEKEFEGPSYLQASCLYLKTYLTGVNNSYKIKMNKILNRKYSEEDAQAIYTLFCNTYQHNFHIDQDELPDFIKVTEIVCANNNEDSLDFDSEELDLELSLDEEDPLPKKPKKVVPVVAKQPYKHPRTGASKTSKKFR